jgi:hypothetical protein
MLARPLPCCRLVQRQNRASLDALWVTEALDRFYFVSKAFRRNGSSAPGPMESRRRLGKRQLANLSEAVHIPLLDFSVWWSLGGTSEQPQWKWEAPTNRRSVLLKEDNPSLAALLHSCELALLPDSQEAADLGNSTYPKWSQPSRTIEDLHQFRELLNVAPAEGVEKLCNTFAQSFKQSLTLALVSEDVICTSLQYFTTDIWNKTADKGVAVSLCTSFYWATWEGIKTCKVLRPTDLGPGVFNKLLLLLSELESSESVQTLAIDIIHTSTTNQLQDMEAGLLSLVKAWVPSWIGLGKSISILAQQEDCSVGGWSKDGHPTAKLSDSIVRLASFLGRLPPELALKIVRESTDHIIQSVFSNFVGPMRILRVLRYSWVSMVANISCADEDLLLHVWYTMDFVPTITRDYTPRIPRLTLREGCKALLDYWISHGQIRAPENVRATFAAATHIAGRTNDARHLLYAIDQHRELCWSKAKFLFRFLRKLGKPHAVYDVFRSLRGSGIKFPASFIASEVEEMSLIDTRCALNIYMLYPTLRCENKPLLLDGCPALIMAMINDSAFKTSDIWRALRIPLYNPRKLAKSSKCLRGTRIALVHKMALEFAQAQCRSPRVALRNVMQCVMYLRRHNVALSPELTRAISYAGITRDLLRKQWVGTEKALWILDLVKRAEGEEVAKTMDLAMTCWRSRHSKRLRRFGRPITGPKD